MGVAPVREPRDFPGAFVEKGQRFGVRDPLEPGVGVALGLLFDRGEPGAPTVRLRLHDADGLPVNEEHIVGGSDIGGVFAHRDAQPRVEVERLPVLHTPTRRLQAGVDPVSGDLLRVLVDGLHARDLRCALLPSLACSHNARVLAVRLRTALRNAVRRLRTAWAGAWLSCASLRICRGINVPDGETGAHVGASCSTRCGTV